MPSARFNEANMLIHLWKRWSQNCFYAPLTEGTGVVKGGAKIAFIHLLEKVEPNLSFFAPLFLKVDKIDIKNKFKSNSIIEYNGAFKRTTTCIQ